MNLTASDRDVLWERLKRLPEFQAALREQRRLDSDLRERLVLARRALDRARRDVEILEGLLAQFGRRP